MPEIICQNQKEYLTSFREQPSVLIKEMEQFAREKRIPILNWHAAEFIEQLVQIHKPKRVLEIGTAIAYTSIKIAAQLNDGRIIDTIEKSKDNIRIAKKFIGKSGQSKKINLIEGDALKIMKSIKDKYNMIFLDADKEDYLNLYKLALPLLDKKGLLIVDNLLWHGYTAAKRVPSKFKNSTNHIRKFNEVFMSEKNLNTSIYAIGDGLGVGIKK